MYGNFAFARINISGINFRRIVKLLMFNCMCFFACLLTRRLFRGLRSSSGILSQFVSIGPEERFDSLLNFVFVGNRNALFVAIVKSYLVSIQLYANWMMFISNRG